MNKIQYTTVDRILARLDRELKSHDISEDDAVEWIGEAMDFLKMPEIQEEAVYIGAVRDFNMDIPKGFHAVLQVARFNSHCYEDPCETNQESIEDLYNKLKEERVPDKPNECGPLVDIIYSGFEKGSNPSFEINWQYAQWIASRPYKRAFTPVRLANKTLYNSLVCKEVVETPCPNSDEYTIVGTTNKCFRFSFEEGMVAVSYLKSATDPDTGYPLIPDVIHHLTAITYYIKWKYAESLAWDGREGFARLEEKNRDLWLEYVKQAKNWTKMPKDIDDLQDLLEETHQLIPRHRRYYNYFGNLGRPDSRKYVDPQSRNRRY